MSVTASRVTVATTATLIATADADGQSVRVLVPTGGQTVSVGPSDVATTTGYDVVAGSSIALELAAGEKLYGIVAGTTQVVHVLGNRA